MGEVIAFPLDRSSAQAARSAAPHRIGAPPRREPLWREVAGAELRAERQRQRRTLAEVARRAGMSVQYLSELERGRKDASSEMLAAACGGLGLSIGELARRCGRAMRAGGPVLLAA